jgi:hypothetical protein
MRVMTNGSHSLAHPYYSLRKLNLSQGKNEQGETSSACSWRVYSTALPCCEIAVRRFLRVCRRHPVGMDYICISALRMLTILIQRINRIQSTLSSDLDHLFVSTLTSLADTQNKTDRSKFIVDVSECLKTYDMLGLWRDAEDVLRRELVRGFVKKVCDLPSRSRGVTIDDNTDYLPWRSYSSSIPCHA